MTDDAAVPVPQHRLFHTLVLMGSALAFSCGGMSDEKVASADGSGASGGRPAGGSPAVGPGGNPLAGAGGSVAGGSGGGLSPTAGMANGGEPGYIDINPFAAGGMGSAVSPPLNPPLAGTGGTGSSAACPPAQWDCSGSPPDCTGPIDGPFYFYALPSACRCDETRPQTAVDCAGIGAFVCRAGVDDPSGADASTVPFDCSCQPASVNGNPCDEAFNRGPLLATVTTDEGDLDLCACSIVLLK
jgi:hypothetical protein